MNMNQFITILLESTFMSTIMTTLISALIIEPFREKKKYKFDEKSVYTIQLLYFVKFIYTHKKLDTP